MSTVTVQETRCLRAPQLVVAREDVRFRNLARDRVLIEIDVRNHGTAASPPRLARLQSAVLGAFVPWKPLTEIPIPPIEPGGTTRLQTVVATPVPQDRQPPFDPLRPSLLTAEDHDDRRPLSPTRGDGVLAHDILRSTHWAGNLNVFVGRHPVERHLARALRIYPGLSNVAMFMVGEGRDAYAFYLAGGGASWDARLVACPVWNRPRSNRRHLAPFAEGLPAVPEGKWHEVDGRSPFLLELTPPRGAEETSVDVHVEQRSSGATAVVEFSFAPEAAGPGCYVVE